MINQTANGTVGRVLDRDAFDDIISGGFLGIIVKTKPAPTTVERETLESSRDVLRVNGDRRLCA